MTKKEALEKIVEKIKDVWYYNNPRVSEDDPVDTPLFIETYGRDGYSSWKYRVEKTAKGDDSWVIQEW